MPSTEKPTAASIGYAGVLPDTKDNYTVESTVLTVGASKSAKGFAVSLAHAATWVTALVLIMAWGNDKLKGATPTDEAKALGNMYGLLIIAILVVVLSHAMFAKKEEMFSSTIASVVLLWMVFFELSLGCAYLAYSLNKKDLYGAAVVCQLLVCGGCAMIVTFYVNFTHNGNLTQNALEYLSNMRSAGSKA